LGVLTERDRYEHAGGAAPVAVETTQSVDFEMSQRPLTRIAAPPTLFKCVDGAIDSENETAACVASESVTLLTAAVMAPPRACAVSVCSNEGPSSSNCSRCFTGVFVLKKADQVA
jgi:hypothetical protein